MIQTTTNSIEGQEITEYLGLVEGEVILGVNALRDFLASIRDITGGRSQSYESKVRECREEALKEMEHQAIERGADGIVGIALTYEVLGETNGMLMVTALGTAVKF